MLDPRQGGEKGIRYLLISFYHRYFSLRSYLTRLYLSNCQKVFGKARLKRGHLQLTTHWGQLAQIRADHRNRTQPKALCHAHTYAHGCRSTRHAPHCYARPAGSCSHLVPLKFITPHFFTCLSLKRTPPCKIYIITITFPCQLIVSRIQ